MAGTSHNMETGGEYKRKRNVTKRKKKKQFRGRKERLRAKNAILLTQLKEREEINEDLIEKKKMVVKENQLLKR